MGQDIGDGTGAGRKCVGIGKLGDDVAQLIVLGYDLALDKVSDGKRHHRLGHGANAIQRVRVRLEAARMVPEFKVRLVNNFALVNDTNGSGGGACDGQDLGDGGAQPSQSFIERGHVGRVGAALKSVLGRSQSPSVPRYWRRERGEQDETDVV